MIIIKEFSFDSAHQLFWHPGKCKNLHGHTYKLQVGIEGNLNSNGIVMDFGELKDKVNKEIIEKYDHQNLNIFFLNPTAELMAKEIFETLSSYFSVAFIKLWETPTSCVLVTKEDYSNAT